MTALSCQKLRDLLGGLTPEEVAKSVDRTDLACNQDNIVKSLKVFILLIKISKY